VSSLGGIMLQALSCRRPKNNVSELKDTVRRLVLL